MQLLVSQEISRIYHKTLVSYKFGGKVFAPLSCHFQFSSEIKYHKAKLQILINVDETDKNFDFFFFREIA